MSDLEQRAREFLTDETDWLADEFREIHREATEAERERAIGACKDVEIRYRAAAARHAAAGDVYRLEMNTAKSCAEIAAECASAIRKGDPNVE